MTISGSSAPPMVDSNLLIYGLLDDHPAASACRAYIAQQGTISLTILTPIEIYFVLTRIYGVAEAQAVQTIERLMHASIEIVPVDETDIAATLQLCASESLDTNDALQFHLCQRLNIARLATDDTRLTQVCRTRGLTVDNPIDQALRRQMAEWEEARLLDKGLPRILGRIHDWLNTNDPSLADKFRNATGDLHRLP